MPIVAEIMFIRGITNNISLGTSQEINKTVPGSRPGWDDT
jgi:hypothetical protein